MPKKNKQLDIICVGSATRDVIFYTNDIRIIKNPEKDPIATHLFATELGAKLRSDDVYFEFGGGAANTAVNFRGLGLRTGVAAGIGNDSDGQAMYDMLHKAKIDTTYLPKSKKYRTGFSFILTSKKTGERTVHVYYGAAADLNLTRTVVSSFNTSWFYISSIADKKWRHAMNAMTEHAKNTGARVAWNPGGTQLTAGWKTVKKWLPYTEVLLLNRDEATELVMSASAAQSRSLRDMLVFLQEAGAKIVVITDGRHGTYVYDGNEFYRRKAPKDKPVSTVGAGDCYGSSFVAGLIRYHGDIKKSMELAQHNATAVVQHVGAQHGLVQWNDLPKRLR